MNVPEGFKQTEVGVIPKDWNLIRIGEAFKFKNGLNKEKRFFGRGTPIVNYMDVFSSSAIFSKNLEGKVTLSQSEINNYAIRKGDVFFTRTSEKIEEIGITSVCLDDANHTVFSGFLLRARPYRTTFEAEFCRFCFASEFVRRQIVKTASITTRALTNGRLLSEIQISIPPDKSEQTAIAAALSDMDALIEGVEKLLEKKRRIKQGAMQELLRPKEGWKTRTLKDVGGIITGGTPSTSIKDYWNGKIPWVTPTDITAKKDIYRTEREITANGIAVIRRVPKDSLLVTCIASIGKNAILRKEGACNQQINAIIPNSDFDVEFLYYLIEDNKNKLISNSGITATLILSKKKFSELQFSFPETKSEQTAIAAILSDMDSEIEQLETQLTKYRQFKTGMMQELLTGKKRLV